MSSFGTVLLIVGAIALFFALQMDTTVEVNYPGNSSYGMPKRVNNIGLMNDKQNFIILSGIVLIAGILMVALGKKKESQQEKDPRSEEDIETVSSAEDTEEEERIFYCQKCGSRLEIDEEEFESKSFTCPECGHVNGIS